MLFGNRRRNTLTDIEHIIQDFITAYNYQGYYADKVGLARNTRKRGTHDIGVINTRYDKIHIVDKANREHLGGQTIHGEYVRSRGITYIYWNDGKVITQIRNGSIIKESISSFNLYRLEDFLTYVNNLKN